MPTIQVQMRRFSIVSAKSFAETVRQLTATIGRPDMNRFRRALDAARTASDLDKVVQRSVGPSNLMEFARFDTGGVFQREQDRSGPRSLRLLVGNPVITNEMARTVPDAAAYAPITILVDERTDGVHLSYDSMVSLIAPYGSPVALLLAKELDAKIEDLLKAAACAGGEEIHAPTDPISETGSLAAADAILMGGLLDHW